METGRQIEENGWRQGTFLSVALAAQARTLRGDVVQPKNGELFMAVSQSCDLVHGKIENEPWCEILRLNPIHKLDSRFSHGKNGRLLDFNVVQQGISQNVRAEAPDRCFLPRELLANSCPETAIECASAELVTVVEWLGKRYSRPALPTAFNELLLGDKKTRKSFEKLLDQGHRTISDIFLWLDPFSEIPTDQRYQVRVLLVTTKEVMDDSAIRSEAESFRNELEAFLSKIPRIELEAVRLQSDDRTSLRQVGEYVVWDFDYLTVRDDSAPAT